MKKLIIYLFLLIFGISCGNKNKENIMKNSDTHNESGANISNELATTNISIDTASVFDNNQIEEYKKNVINKGDALSFTKLIIHYEDKSNYRELQKYTLIMADKYNNGDGCSQAFVNIIAMNNNNKYNDLTDLDRINEKAKKEALKYLEKGSSLNDIDCMSMLSDIYRNGIGVEKDVKKADELKKKIAEL